MHLRGHLLLRLTSSPSQQPPYPQHEPSPIAHKPSLRPGNQSSANCLLYQLGTHVEAVRGVNHDLLRGRVEFWDGRELLGRRTAHIHLVAAVDDPFSEG
jgi:hypothetical protein